MSFDSALTNLFMAIMELPPAERKLPSGSFYFQYESRMGPKVTVAAAKKEEANHLLSMLKDVTYNLGFIYELSEQYKTMYQKNEAIKEKFRLVTLAAKEQVRSEEMQMRVVDLYAKTWLSHFEYRFGSFVIESEKSIEIGHVVIAKEPSYTSLYAIMPLTVLNKGMTIEDAKKLVEDLQQGITLAEKIASRKPETYDPPKQFVVGGVMVGRYVTGDPRFYTITGITDKKVKLQRLKVKKDGSPGSEAYGTIGLATKLTDNIVTLHTEKIVMYDGQYAHIEQHLDGRYISEQLKTFAPEVKAKAPPKAKKTVAKAKAKAKKVISKAKTKKVAKK